MRITMNKDKGAVKDWLNNADILTGALPYMQKYNGSIIVIKYGGNAMADSELVESFCNDIVFLKQSGLKACDCSWRRPTNWFDA